MKGHLYRVAFVRRIFASWLSGFVLLCVRGNVFILLYPQGSRLSFIDAGDLISCLSWKSGSTDTCRHLKMMNQLIGKDPGTGGD